MSTITKTKAPPTIGQTIYKGSYNYLTDLQTESQVEFSIEISNNKKVFKQLSGYNTQRQFATITASKVDEILTAKIVLLKDERSKKNFLYFVNIAKKVFEPSIA